MSQSYNDGSAFDYELAKRMEQLHVDDIQFDKQGNIIFNEFEQKARSSENWKDLEKQYGINFGDVVKIDNHLGTVGRVQEFSVSKAYRDIKGLLREDVHIKLWGGITDNFHCSEAGSSVKECLKYMKVQPKQRKLSIKEKLKNTIKTKVKTFKQGGAAHRLANRRANAKDIGITR